MPQTFINTYSPQTPIGAALQNASLALFGGMKSPAQREMEEARARYYDAGVADRQARARKHVAEAAKFEAERSGRAKYLDTAVTHLFGEQNAPVARNFLRTRKFGEQVVDPGIALTGDDEGNPIDTPIEIAPRVTAPAARPGWFTPELENELMREAALSRLIMAGGGNAEQLAKAGGHLQDQGFERDLVSGRMRPHTFFRLGRKPVVGVDEGYLVDLTGAGGPPRPLGTAEALIRQRDASAGASNASAQASRAHAGLFNAQRDNAVAQGKVVTVNVPGIGPVNVFAKDLSDDTSKGITGRVFGNQREGSMDRFLRPGPKDIETITNEINALKGPFAGAAFSDTPEAQRASNALMGRAMEYFSTPGSPGYGNHALAAGYAFQDVLPEGVEDARSGIPFVSSKLRPKGEARTTNLPAVSGRAARGERGPAPAAPFAADAGKASPPKPKGKADQQIIDEANAAIRKGANREAVLARLKAWGVRTENPKAD